jgi:hypothetical protein
MIGVRDVLERANMLLRVDKQNRALVESVWKALESDGVTWAWQLLHLHAS